MFSKRLAALAAGILTLGTAMVSLSIPAHAAEPPNAESLIQGLVSAPDPKAAYAALTQEERDAVDAVTRVASIKITPSAKAQVTTSRSAAAASCWQGTAKGEGKNTLGGTIFTYWVTGKWCASSGKVTSATFVSGSGETSTPGWSYEGRIGQGARVGSDSLLGNVWAQHKFVLTWDWVQTAYPCVSMHGSPYGYYSQGSSCSG
ncbi:hypothetical protein [Microbispora bryophytorum]|uniref:hypothetical protein n=1 Tax=Microbispora bryophytorum TaxID=1460882 RepID=UPI0033DE786B